MKLVAEPHNEDGAFGFEGASVEEDVTVLVELMGTEDRWQNRRRKNRKWILQKGALESETDDIRVEFIEPKLHRQLGKPRALQLQQL